jgi:hypothetical protein
MPVQLSRPPENGSTAYSVTFNNPVITHTDMSATKVGNRIQAKYDQGAWTPAQKIRAALIAIIVTAAVGSPFAFVAIPLVIVAVMGTCYLLTRGPDLDNPHVRNKHIDNVARMAFTDLAEAYNPEQISGYALLSAKIPRGNISHSQGIYTYVNKLLAIKRELETARDKALNVVEGIYNRKTLPARAVLDSQQNAANWRSLGTNVAISSIQNSRRQPSLGLEVGRLAYNVAEGVNDANNRADYETSVGDWRVWLSREREAIQAAYSTGVARLSTLYSDAFANPVVVN